LTKKQSAIQKSAKKLANFNQNKPKNKQPASLKTKRKSTKNKPKFAGKPHNTAYYVHIVLALRLPWVTVGYYLGILHFMFSAQTVPGVSQPSSNVAREIRISQGPQSY